MGRGLEHGALRPLLESAEVLGRRATRRACFAGHDALVSSGPLGNVAERTMRWARTLGRRSTRLPTPAGPNQHPGSCSCGAAASGFLDDGGRISSSRFPMNRVEKLALLAPGGREIAVRTSRADCVRGPPGVGWVSTGAGRRATAPRASRSVSVSRAGAKRGTRPRVLSRRRGPRSRW